MDLLDLDLPFDDSMSPGSELSIDDCLDLDLDGLKKLFEEKDDEGAFSGDSSAATTPNSNTTFPEVSDSTIDAMMHAHFDPTLFFAAIATFESNPPELPQDLPQDLPQQRPHAHARRNAVTASLAYHASPRRRVVVPAHIVYRHPTTLVENPADAFDELKNLMVLAATDPNAPRRHRQRQQKL